MLAEAHSIARARAIAETGLADADFPEACPFTGGSGGVARVSSRPLITADNCGKMARYSKKVRR
jgi:hypothetical protein